MSDINFRVVMIKFFKFLLLAVPFLAFAVFVGVREHGAVERKAFSGRVTFIEWKSRNHGMPLIEIVHSNGIEFRFHHHRIALDATQLKVGDTISKVEGSKMCDINQTPILCIR